jgi:hypothetical protein
MQHICTENILNQTLTVIYQYYALYILTHTTMQHHPASCFSTRQNLFIQVHYHAIAQTLIFSSIMYMKPDDMPDAEEFDEREDGEEGLTEFDRQRHVADEDDQDLIEDEDDSFVDELDEEE